MKQKGSITKKKSSSGAGRAAGSEKYCSGNMARCSSLHTEKETWWEVTVTDTGNLTLGDNAVKQATGPCPPGSSVADAPVSAPAGATNAC